MRHLLVAIVVLSSLWSWPSAPASAQDKDSKGLPADVVAAWQKAGAQPAWMMWYGFGQLDFQHGTTGDAEGVPAFQLRPWQAGLLHKLPAPERSFGLYLGGTEITDAGLKELVRFKELQYLYLGRTPVTDAGLKELTGIKQLQVLYLPDNKVSNAGLKELAGCKQLQLLDVARPK